MKELLTKEQQSELASEFPFFTNKQLAENYGVSIGFIKKFGHKNILLKCKEHLSLVRSLAQTKNKQFNMVTNAPIEKVACIMKWFRTFTNVGDTRKGQFESPKKCHTVSVLLSRWNIEEGREIGIRLHGIYDRINSQVTITAVKWHEDYEDVTKK